MTPEDIEKASKIIELASHWPTHQDLYDDIRARDWRVMQVQYASFTSGMTNVTRVGQWLNRWPRLLDVITELDQERRNTDT